MVTVTTDITIRMPQPVSGSDLGMLSHLEALTYSFERDRQCISCVLIYSEPNADGIYQSVVADDTGYEGIACVDDTARAVLLALGIYERTRSRRALALAKRWLTFVEYMQYPDGSFANFIRNAAGIRNASGPTSRKGGYAWSMRALWALARMYRLTGHPECLERFQACHLAPTPDGKVNGVLTLGLLELYAKAPSEEIATRIVTHCEWMVGSASPYFRDDPGTDRVHLWGYHQLHAVSAAARVLRRPDWLPACRSTVRSLIEPNVQNKMWYSYPDRQRDGSCAYSVTPVVQGLASMYGATGVQKYRRLALQASAWFYGRNEAGSAMYDPTTGRCRDGIMNGQASRNVGAESSIEAGLAELERRALLEA